VAPPARLQPGPHLGELGGEQPLRRLGVEAGRGQRLARGAAGEQDSQQHVLGADVVVAQPQRRLQGARERGLAVLGEAQLAQDRLAGVPARRRGPGPDRGADLLSGQPGPLDDPCSQAFRLGQQRRRQVRRADGLVPGQPAGGREHVAGARGEPGEELLSFGDQAAASARHEPLLGRLLGHAHARADLAP
jgi:hypothetical protein